MSAAHSASSATHEFSLVRGGPTYRLLHDTRLLRGTHKPTARAATALAAATWLPFLALASVDWTMTGRLPGIVFELSVHARLLAAVPLLLVAEDVLDERTGYVVDRIIRTVGLEQDTRSGAKRAMKRVEGLRDSFLVEVLLLAASLLVGQAVLWGFASPEGFIGGKPAVDHSLAHVYYALVGLPVFVFLLWRALFHWALWALLAFHLARLDLRPLVTHPDHCAGLEYLSEPVQGFAVQVLSASVVFSSTWATDILRGRSRLQDHAAAFAGFAVVSLFLALGPLLPFARALYVARREGIRAYDYVALGFVRLIDARWIHGAGGESPVGNPDVQSLSDLHNAYHELCRTRVVPFGPRAVLVVFVALIVPMAPLIVTRAPPREVFGQIGRFLLGGL